jgi:hypothetical protein
MSPFPYTSAYGIISTKNLQNGDELIFAMGAMTDLKMSAPGNEQHRPYYIIDNGLPMRAIVDGSQVLCHS